jgi:proteasome lid subunit RPN8/RPN11
LLDVAQPLIDDMIAHARAEDPNECCGVIAGADGTAGHGYRITNTAASPFRYLMDPQEFLDADKDAEGRDMSLVAFYHSHTRSAPYPSDTDVRMALESGWLDPFYILVSLENKDDPQVRLYTITPEGEIVESELRVV